MTSGYTVVAVLVGYRYHSDPHDMVKYSVWEITGFPGKTPILECTKDEFMKIYGDYYYQVL